jgi:tetraacyldisaccharide 4'-kinase
VLPWVLRLFVRAVCSTLRYRWHGLGRGLAARNPEGPVIYAFWHARFFPLIYTHRRRHVHVVVSRHRDGELVGRVIQGLGFGTVWGSTTRGGRDALYGSLRVLRSGADVAITPDGPRGPREVAQIGAVALARLSGRAIVPVATACRPEIALRSWDRYRLPLPFARCVVAYGPPLFIPPTTPPGGLAAFRSELDRRLRALTLHADQLVRRPGGRWLRHRRQTSAVLRGAVGRAWRAGMPLWARTALLLPSQLWRWGAAARRLLYERGWLRRRTAGPWTVSVGNIHVGGTGKTPLVVALATDLRRRGVPVMVLSKGYGAPRGAGGVWTVPGEGVAGEWRWVGDEPALIARMAGVAVVSARSRRRALREIAARHPRGVLLLDDGYQALGVKRDLDIALVPADQPLGGTHVMPAGPLREGPEALSFADLIVVTGAAPNAGIPGRLRQLGVPTVRATRRLTEIRRLFDGEPIPAALYRGTRVVAFAGLADPRGFWNDLRRAGLDLAEEVVFPDHHPYEANDLHDLVSRARWAGCSTLVTTEKDAVRLPAHAPPELQVWVAQMRLTIEEEHWQVLLDRIQHRMKGNESDQ